MTIKHILLTGLFILKVPAFGQSNIIMDANKSDLVIFKTILEKGHPNLYKYIEKERLDSLYNTLKKDSCNTTQLGLLKNMYKITDAIQDGHIEIYPPIDLVSNSNHFPLTLKIIQNKTYNYITNTSIPAGSIIESINEIPMEEILASLEKYVSSDGSLVQKKQRIIEQNFDVFHLLEYGATKNYTIQFIDPLGIRKKIELAAITQTDLRVLQNFVNNEIHPFNNKNSSSNYSPDAQKISISYDHKSHSALLKVKSFSIGSHNFNKYLDQLFSELKKNKIANLIIDIRHNNGGNRANTLRLMSYIATDFFKQRETEHVGSLNIPEKHYAVGSYYEEELSLKEKFKNHPVYDGWTSNFDNLESLMVPTKTRFKGAVYVLISGNTLNEASDFALLTKNDTKITLIGEETGCTYSAHNIGLPVYYKLPQSGIQFSMHLKNVKNFVKIHASTQESGVIPDRFIPYTLKDLVTCDDPQLSYVLKLLGRK